MIKQPDKAGRKQPDEVKSLKQYEQAKVYSKAKLVLVVCHVMVLPNEVHEEDEEHNWEYQYTEASNRLKQEDLFSSYIFRIENSIKEKDIKVNPDDCKEADDWEHNDHQLVFLSCLSHVLEVIGCILGIVIQLRECHLPFSQNVYDDDDNLKDHHPFNEGHKAFVNKKEELLKNAHMTNAALHAFHLFS